MVEKLPMAEAAAVLLDLSAPKRADVLAALEPELRERILAHLNTHMAAAGDRSTTNEEAVCPKCAFRGPFEMFTGDLDDMAQHLAGMEDLDAAARIIEALDEDHAARILLAMDPWDEGLLAAGILGKCAPAKVGRCRLTLGFHS